jgi:hypothetical protein
MADHKSLDSCTDLDLADRFPDYLAGRLQLDEAEKIEKHLAGCAHCELQMDLWLFMVEEGVTPKVPVFSKAEAMRPLASRNSRPQRFATHRPAVTQA